MRRKKRREKVEEFQNILKAMQDFEMCHKTVKFLYGYRQKLTFTSDAVKLFGTVTEKNIGKILARSTKLVSRCMDVREAINTFAISPKTMRHVDILELRLSVYIVCNELGLGNVVANAVLAKLLEEATKNVPELSESIGNFCENKLVKLAEPLQIHDALDQETVTEAMTN